MKEGEERMLGAGECYPKESQLWSARDGEPLKLKQQGKLCSRIQITGVRKTTFKGSGIMTCNWKQMQSAGELSKVSYLFSARRSSRGLYNFIDR